MKKYWKNREIINVVKISILLAYRQVKKNPCILNLAFISLVTKKKSLTSLLVHKQYDSCYAKRDSEYIT